MNREIFIQVTGKGFDTLTRKVISTNAALNQTTTVVSKVSTNLKTGERTASGFTKTITDSGKKTSIFSGQLNSLAIRFVGLNALVSLGTQKFRELQQFLGESVDMFRKFEQSMAEVSTILTEVNLKTLPQLEVGVESLSVTFGKSANDLAGGLYQILSAAVEAEKSLNLLYIATKASIAGLTDVKTSVDILTSVLNAYGLTVEQMTHVSDVMFESIRRGKFRYEDLASALGFVAPIAAQTGVSFEELSAVFSSTTRQGLHLDTVSRGLALSLQNIIKPSKQATELAAQYGIELSLASLRAKGLVGFIEELNEKTKGNAAIISQLIPNMRSYRVMMVLAGDGIDELNEDIELMSESMGRTDKAFQRMAKTAQMATNILTQTFEQIKRDIGETTVQVDLFFKQMDIFKGYLTQDIIMGGLFGGLGLAGAIGRAGEKTMQTMSRVSKVINRNTANWQKQFEEALEPLVEVPEKPLARRLLAGETIDITPYKEAGDAYLEASREWAEGMGELMKGKLLGTMALPEILELTASLEEQKAEIDTLQNSYNRWKATFDDLEDVILDHSENIDIFIEKLGRLQKEIGDVGVLYDGTLGKELQVMEGEKQLADMNEYLGLSIQDIKFQTELANRNFDWYNVTLADAIKTVREYEDAQKKATQAQKEFNFALKENQILTMQIQLAGMMRRRGLTRSEQRTLKRLQIERTKIQIEEAKKELAAQKNLLTEEMDNREKAYYEAKQYIDALTRDEAHALWLLKDTRQEDINNLMNVIQTKETAYAELTERIFTEHHEMANAVGIYRDLIKQTYGDDIPSAIRESIKALTELIVKQKEAIQAEIPTPEPFTPTAPSPGEIKVARRIKEDVRGILRNLNIPGFQRGTPFVPETGLYMLHRGEGVSPAGEKRGETFEINIVNHNTITSEMDMEKFASMQAHVIQSELGDRRTGRSTYRFR